MCDEKKEYHSFFFHSSKLTLSLSYNRVRKILWKKSSRKF